MLVGDGWIESKSGECDWGRKAASTVQDSKNSLKPELKVKTCVQRIVGGGQVP